VNYVKGRNGRKRTALLEGSKGPNLSLGGGKGAWVFVGFRQGRQGPKQWARTKEGGKRVSMAWGRGTQKVPKKEGWRGGVQQKDGRTWVEKLRPRLGKEEKGKISDLEGARRVAFKRSFQGVESKTARKMAQEIAAS